MSIIKCIKTNLNIEKVKVIVLYLTILFLPANLFIVARPPWVYLHGILIDYWAPKLYVSTLLIWLLWLVNYYQVIQKASLKRIVTRGKAAVSRNLQLFCRQTKVVLALGLLFWVLARATTTAQPLISFFWLASWLAGPGLLLLFWSKNRPWFNKYLTPAVLTSALFQAFLAWYQFFWQHSLGPYWVFGEPAFRVSSFLATSDWWPTVRSLPYGSTPHPNVLAAWIVVGIVFAWPGFIQKKHLSISILFIMAILFFTILITESLTALTSVPLLVALYQMRWRVLSRFITQKKSLLTLAALAIIATLAWQTIVLAGNRLWSTPSFQRRAILLTSVGQQWPRWLLWGEGLGQNIRLAAAANIGLFQGRFLQPVHSSPLFLLIDLGIGAIILLFAFSFSVNYLYSFYLIFLLSVLPIFSLDHFSVSLISGSYVLILLSMFFYNHSLTKKPIS